MLRRNLRGEIAEGDDGRERAAVGDGDDVRRGRVGEEIERLAVARIDLDDRFLFETKSGKRSPSCTRLCSMAWKVSCVAPTRVERDGPPTGFRRAR
jgi:hypothetical protein